jgi:MarR family transcriptional regulator, transcriptional regulator for hemolysin
LADVRSADDSLGLFVTRAARDLGRAFDDVLVAAGGSTPTWLVLLALSTGPHATQRELAEAVGVRQPTLIHHLDAMERAGLVSRDREPGNRRVQQVRTTDVGEQLFLRLRRTAAAFDGRLTAGLDGDQIADLRRLLGQLVENAQPD